MQATEFRPHDVGNGLVCASFAADGTWLSVGTVHPAVGMVELVGTPPFDERSRGDPHAVRRYRDSLTDPAHGVLRWRLGPGWAVRDRTAWAPPGRPTVVQRLRLRQAGSAASLEFSGALAPPALAEITEVAPVAPRTSGTVLRTSGSALLATTSDPVATARVDVGGGCGAWTVEGTRIRLALADGAGELELTVAVTLTVDGLDPPTPGPFDPPVPAPALPTPPLARITEAARRYTAGCTALSVGPDEVTVLTDHRLLPLSWTRDAYYQAVLLLATGAEEVVERHLRWLWGRGRDADGVWQRSHHPHGPVKDPAYQADQQLYPILELADFRRVAGRWPRPPATAAWGRLVAATWAGLPTDDGLLAGAENPADDPAGLPYLLSSQILLWYTARRLVQWAGELGLNGAALAAAAQRTHAAVARRFVCPGPNGPQWAYESDGAGGHRLYHDANDLPTALAPLWGFCPPGDPHWLATMRFAFSPANPGYVPGPHGGLGSLHTPGTWSLGDVQEWVAARLSGDRDRVAATLDRLAVVSGETGRLPETYDPHTGGWLARPWFAWPGAALGALHLLDSTNAGPWAADAPVGWG